MISSFFKIRYHTPQSQCWVELQCLRHHTLSFAQLVFCNLPEHFVVRDSCSFSINELHFSISQASLTFCIQFAPLVYLRGAANNQRLIFIEFTLFIGKECGFFAFFRKNSNIVTEIAYFCDKLLLLLTSKPK